MKGLLVVFCFTLISAAVACQQKSYSENRGDVGMMGPGMMGPGMMGPAQTNNNEQVPGAAGSAIFYRNCSGCHPNGGNSIMPNRPLIGSRPLSSFQTFLAFIRSPLPPMPAFPPEAISDTEARQLYQFIEADMNR
jgi:cytochrome c6